MNSDSVSLVNDAEVCDLDYDVDEECGKVYFNKNSLMLKFGCLTCKQVYVDINLYCRHLSTHLSDEDNVKNPSVDCEEFSTMRDDESTLEKERPASKNSIEECDDSSSNMIVFSCNEVEDDARSEELSDLENSIQTEKETDDDPLKMSEDIDKIRFQENGGLNISNQLQDIMLKAEEYEKKTKAQGQPTLVKVIQVRNRVQELYNQVLARQNGDEDLTTIAFSESSDEDDDSEVASNKKKRYKPPKNYDAQLPSLHPLLQTYGNKCPACHRNFRNAISLAGHLRTHYLETNNRIKLAYKCMDCGKLCNKWHEVYVHQEETHFPDGFVCKICQAKCKSIALLKQHIKYAHLLNRLACKECERTFQRFELLNKHCLRWHPPPANAESNPEFQCTHCSRKYLTEYDAAQHSQHHVRISEVCEICGKVTYHLRHHKESHKPKTKRVHHCIVCKMKFSFSSALSRHLRVVHKTSMRVLKQPLSSVNQSLEHNYIVNARASSGEQSSSQKEDDCDDIITVEAPPMAREETIH